MPEIKKFKKLYKPLTPEQRQKSVESAIAKRIASFEKMDQKHFRKLTKAAKEAKEFEAKKLRRRLKFLQESDTAEEAEKKGAADLAKVAELEKKDIEECETELKVAGKINPEAITTLAFKKLHVELEKIAKKEQQRILKEEARREAEAQNGGQPEVKPEPEETEVGVKRERPDDSEAPPLPKKSKKLNTPEKVAEKIAKDARMAQRALEAKEALLKKEEEDKAAEEAKKPKQHEQQMGVSAWAQNKIEANTILPTWEDAGAFRQFAEKVMKHAHFNDAFLYVKKVQLQQKAKLEKFKILCAKHQMLAEQKALEAGLNPPPPKVKKGKKGQKAKKFFPKLTEEEKKAAKKFKYSKNKERNKQRKIEQEQRKAAADAARAQKAQAAE